jgi:hypothetical protein
MPLLLSLNPKLETLFGGGTIAATLQLSSRAERSEVEGQCLSFWLWQSQ